MTGNILQDKNQKSSSEAPSEKKGSLLVFALVLFASAGLFLFIVSKNLEFLMVESFGTMVFLFMGLVAVYALNIQPYLIKKYYLKYNVNPKNKFPYYVINFIAMSLALAIPLIFGERIYTLLVSNNLPPSLPVYILLPLALVIRYFFREKLKLPDDGQQDTAQNSALELRPSDKIYGYLPHALFAIAMVLSSYFAMETVRFLVLGVITALSLFFGLALIYAAGVGPFLNKIYLPQFKENPRKKIPYVTYNLLAFSLWLSIPLAFTKTIYNFLKSNDLPDFLPFFILLPVPLIFFYLGRDKSKGGKLKINWRLVLLLAVPIVTAIAATFLVRP